MVNIFIAFMLPKEASSDMYKVAEDVKELFLPDGKDEKFFHCTLLFIGRVAEKYVPFIQEKMKSIAAVQAPITICIDDIGYFYSTKKDRIKVLYAKPTVMPSALNELCAMLYDTIGKPLEGKTTPPIHPAMIHFTITKRLKRKLSREDFESIKTRLRRFNIPVTMDNIGLYYCKDAEHRYYRVISRYDYPSHGKYPLHLNSFSEEKSDEKCDEDGIPYSELDK
jgi:2'-5' RNA ligase